MILVYTAVEGGKELDRITITDKKTTYSTGRARTVLATSLRRYGNRATGLMYRDWSNGYVKLSEAR